jgi:SAM-dependent methyltransferase
MPAPTRLSLPLPRDHPLHTRVGGALGTHYRPPQGLSTSAASTSVGTLPAHAVSLACLDTCLPAPRGFRLLCAPPERYLPSVVSARVPQVKGTSLGPLEPLSRCAARLGRRFGVDWLIYNPIEFLRLFIYAHTTRNAVADSLVRTFPEAQSFADIGAGTGTYAAALRRRGKTVVACEWSVFGRLASRGHGLRSLPLDLTRSPPTAEIRAIDVAYCLEVAEHVSPEMGDRLVKYLATFPLVLFSAAHPGQNGLGHVNEQPAAYWIERFGGFGMRVDQDRSDRIVREFRAMGAPPWLVDNAIVFSATDRHLRELAGSVT